MDMSTFYSLPALITPWISTRYTGQFKGSPASSTLGGLSPVRPGVLFWSGPSRLLVLPLLCIYLRSFLRTGHQYFAWGSVCTGTGYNILRLSGLARIIFGQPLRRYIILVLDGQGNYKTVLDLLVKSSILILVMEQDLQKILYSEQTILSRLDSVGSQLSKDYAGKDLTVIAIMNGSIMFMSDLLKRVNIPLQIDCWSVSSYHGSKSSGTINFRQHDIVDVSDRHVLLLDDILDSGLTLHTIKNKVLDETKALSVKSCVLLSKKVERVRPIEADYVAFDIENEFVVGYGLDYNEHYRNLPYVAVLKSPMSYVVPIE